MLLTTPTLEPSLSVVLGTIIPLLIFRRFEEREDAQRRIVAMSERTVAIHVKINGAFPKEVLTPSGPRSESKALFTVLNMAMERADAASRKIVARKEVMAPPRTSRGAQQADRMAKIGVSNVRMNDST